MAAARRYFAKLAFAVLIICGTLSSQEAWLTPEHAHRGVPTHCCAACHAGHLPLIEPAVAVKVLPPTRNDWFDSSDEFQRQREALAVICHSRAPPSLSVL